MTVQTRTLLWATVVAAISLSAGIVQAENFQSLHAFDADTGDGFDSSAGLTLAGSKLYGTTAAGGAEGGGTVFTMNVDGSGYQLLRSFAFSSGPPFKTLFTGTGEAPLARVTIVGSKLFGTTAYGGQVGVGSIYSMNVDGTGFQELHSFSNVGGSTSVPYAGLTLAGSKLYGTATSGHVFSINLDGSGYQDIHNFGGATLPYAGLTLVGSKLYGTTSGAGAGVYSMTLDGTGFQNLHAFGSVPHDGNGATADVTAVGSRLYGTTPGGGEFNQGTAYSMNLDGSDYQLLHSFKGSAGEGWLPRSELTLVGERLYGTTSSNGTNAAGGVFRMNLDGSAYQEVHLFDGSDGANPWAGLTLAGTTLYGTTLSGGSGSGFDGFYGGVGGGTIYSIAVPEPSSLLLASAAFVLLCWKSKRVVALRYPFCLAAMTVAAIVVIPTRTSRADTVVTWGNNAWGQLGVDLGFQSDGALIGSNVPVAVPGMLSGVTAVAAGGGHSLALKNGGVYAWGDKYGYANASGHGTTPVAISGLTSDVTAVEADGGASFAIQNGALFAFGGYNPGQLGNDSFAGSSTPVAVTGLSSGVSAVSAGAYHVLAVRNGVAYGWGYNVWGAVGDGTMTDRSSPVAILGGGVTDVAAGGSESFGGTSMAIRMGALYTWGAANDGLLGRSGSQVTPGVVSSLTSGVTAIAAGAYHNLAVQNGHVFAWGANTNGQLGDGTTTGHNRPELIDPDHLNNIVSVAAGISTSYALAADGSLWVWGTSPLGLSGPTQNLYLTPQHLLPPPGYEFTAIDTDAGYAGNFFPTRTHAVATLALVPEPSSALLLALGGLLGTVMWVRPVTIGNAVDAQSDSTRRGVK